MSVTSPPRWPDLSEPACAGRAFAGAKAAGLARAAAAGFPVPRSVVVPCALSVPVLGRAWPTAGRHGIHAARLEVMEAGEAGEAGLAGLTAAVEPLGPALAVRSSSPAEDDPALAGAFSSLMGVAPDQAGTAVLAVWASAIASEPAVPRRGGMGVLIQPEINPGFAGTAELGPDGSVSVVATDGPAGPLMAGWATGISVAVTTAGRLEPPVAGPRWDGEVLRAAASLARRAAGVLGDNLIEWAWADGKLWLVQARRTDHQPAQRTQDAGPAPAGRSASNPAGSRRLLRATRWPGELAERWLVPWISAGTPLDEQVPWVTAGTPLDRPAPGSRKPATGAARLWERFTVTSDALIEQVWATAPGGAARRAAAVVTALRAGQADAPPGTAGPALVRDWLSVAVDLMARLGIGSWREFLALPADLDSLLAGRTAVPDLARRAQRAALSWEAARFSAISDCGERLIGTAVAPGTGCGPCVGAASAALGGTTPPDPPGCPHPPPRPSPRPASGRPSRLSWLSPPTGLGQSARPDRPAGGALPPRAVIVAAYPLPQYAPLLMGAAGLVCRNGSEAAHLITVARSLGVPAVIGADLTTAAAAGERYAAVDGYAGTVSVWSEGAVG
jgi:phosphohistidine swiveling domain-containing protein